MTASEAATAPSKFVWPPRRAKTLPADAAGSPDATPAGPAASTCAPVRVGSPGYLRSAWLTVEREWLGLAVAPWRERAAAVGWHADEHSAYCPRCLVSVGAFEADADGCPACRRRRLRWSRGVRLGEYRGLLRDAVHGVKFGAWRRLAWDCGRELGRAVARDLAMLGVARERVVIVPVPTTWRRRMARGIDHTLALCRGVRREVRAPIVRALAREHRPSQVNIPMSERRRNVAGTMRPRRGAMFAGCVVILVDDVMTTGATMSEAARALLAGHRAARGGVDQGVGTVDLPEIWAVVLGRSPDRNRGHSPEQVDVLPGRDLRLI